jgi:hypothetical protein
MSYRDLCKTTLISLLVANAGIFIAEHAVRDARVWFFVAAALMALGALFTLEFVKTLIRAFRTDRPPT